MSDEWDEEKIGSLELSSFTLPVLRDLGVLFVALLEFDLFLGPTVTLKEIVKGSTFIKQLVNARKLSEVYAGLAGTQMDTIIVEEKDNRETIVVARRRAEQEEEVISVFLISVTMDSSIEEVKYIAERTLQKCGGMSTNVSQALQETIREFIQKEKQLFKTQSKKQHIEFIEENRPLKSLRLSNINGFIVIDLKNNYADFRNIPVWISEKKIDPKKVLQFLELKLEEINPEEVQTLFFKSIPFMIYKYGDTYTFLHLKDSGLRVANSISKWFEIISRSIASEWRSASKEEILGVLSFLDEAPERGTIKEKIESTAHLLIRAGRIKPSLNYAVGELFENPPFFLTGDQWRGLKKLNGELSILEISTLWVQSVLDVVLIIEWARTRKILYLLEDRVN